MYMVRFERKDKQPDEEYLYHRLCDALVHFVLFRDDDSELYMQISVFELCSNRETLVTQKRF